MDVLDEELLQFWKVLNANQVKYIMVGGFATRFHGFDRATDDLDNMRLKNWDMEIFPRWK